MSSKRGKSDRSYPPLLPLFNQSSHSMKMKTCERCHEQKSIVFFHGRSKFIMPWCKECRALDPQGAKLIADRLRQAQLSEEKLKAKNEKRKLRAREIRQELRDAEETARTLALDA